MVQAAQQLVEVLEAGRGAGQLALALVGRLGHLDGVVSASPKGWKPPS